MTPAAAMAAPFAPARETGFLPLLAAAVAWGLSALEVAIASSAGGAIIAGLSFAVDAYFVSELLAGPLDGTTEEQTAWATSPIPSWALPLYQRRIAELRAHATTYTGLERSRLIAGAGAVEKLMGQQAIASTEAALGFLERRYFGAIKPGISSIWRTFGLLPGQGAVSSIVGPASLAAAAFGYANAAVDYALPDDPTAPASAGASPAAPPSSAPAAGASAPAAAPARPARPWVRWLVIGVPSAVCAALILPPLFRRSRHA